jgi:hypothetical protein
LLQLVIGSFPKPAMRIASIEVECLARGLGELAVSGLLTAALLSLLPQFLETYRGPIDDICKGVPKSTSPVVLARIFPAKWANPLRPFRSELTVEEQEAR